MKIKLTRLLLTAFIVGISISGCKTDAQDPVTSTEESSTNSLKTTAALASNIRKKVMHLNICGNVCWEAADADGDGTDSRGSISRIDKVISAVDSYQPHVLTFNEICYSQYRALRTELISRGYGSTYASTTTAGGCDNFDNTNGQGFGNAIFFKGTVSSTQQKFLLPNTAGEEPRHLLYTTVTLDGKSTKIATTHITPKSAMRTQQIQFVANKAAEWIAQGTPVIITGDFNAQPGDAEMGLMYSHSGGTGKFQEADESNACPSPLTFCRGGEATFNESKKIDYIFFSAVHFGGMEGDAKSRYPNPISDHNTLQGSALWQ